MGDVKNEMKPTTKDLTKSEDGKMFGLLKRKPKQETVSDKAQTFADMVNKADESLQGLIMKKEAELDTEKGSEDYNRKALAHLKTMSFHLDAVINAAADYSELKH